MFPEMLMTKLAACAVKRKPSKVMNRKAPQMKESPACVPDWHKDAVDLEASKTERIITANSSVWETFSAMW